MHVVEPPRVSVVMAIDHVHDPTVYIDREAISRVPPVALFLVDWFNLFNAHFILPFFYVLNYVGWWNTLGYCMYYSLPSSFIVGVVDFLL